VTNNLHSTCINPADDPQTSIFNLFQFYRVSSLWHEDALSQRRADERLGGAYAPMPPLTADGEYHKHTASSELTLPN
jgi:hypothetical protein